MSDPQPHFAAGFASRHEAVAQALHRAFSTPETGFAPADIRARAQAPVSFSPQGEPKHFSPADPEANPTEGWDPFDADAPQTSFIDPVAAAHAAGFAEGRAAALADADEEARRNEALLERLAAALGAGGHYDRERMAAQLRQAVLHLVTRIIGEVEIAPELLTRRIEAATDCLADSAESALLRLNPADVALLEGKLPKTVFAIGDDQLARGTFVLESASTIVEDGPDLWLEQLAQAIDRAAVPPLC